LRAGRSEFETQSETFKPGSTLRTAMRPLHPENCPRCGKPTWNWYYLSTRIWIECEHCGFKESVSNTPVSGANTDSTTRKVPISKA